jgi:hypothetical protein
MKTWFYAYKATGGVAQVLALASGPEHLWMMGTRRPRLGNGYGFFEGAAAASAFIDRGFTHEA